MSHYCKICGQNRRNEKFSGKGHKLHICKDCAQLPKEELKRIQSRDEITQYLFTQSYISKKNVKRLRELTESVNSGIARFAGVALEVAKIAPSSSRRLGKLADRDIQVFLKFVDLSLTYDEYFLLEDILPLIPVDICFSLYACYFEEADAYLRAEPEVEG